MGNLTALAQQLASLDSCAVSDALDKLGLPGVVTGVAAVTVPRRISGRVLTVEIGPVAGAAPGTRHIATAAIEAAAEGDIIVVAAGGRTGAPGWGGILSLAAADRRPGGGHGPADPGWRAGLAGHVGGLRDDAGPLTRTGQRAQRPSGGQVARGPGQREPAAAACRACQTRRGEAGMSMCRTPRSARASTTAFCTAGVAPMVPASPSPLAPSGL